MWAGCSLQTWTYLGCRLHAWMCGQGEWARNSIESGMHQTHGFAGQAMQPATGGCLNDHRGCDLAFSGGRSAPAPDAPVQGMQHLWHGCACPVGLACHAPQLNGQTHISLRLMEGGCLASPYVQVLQGKWAECRDHRDRVESRNTDRGLCN